MVPYLFMHHVCCSKANKNVDVNKWIARFVAETKCEDGSTYPPWTIAIIGTCKVIITN